jgi:predicted naringenin-chalcone synthase
LSGYVPELIEEDFGSIVERATGGVNEISHWCVHPGGKRILEAVEKSLGEEKKDLSASYEILNDYGNLSSASILFVLQKIMHTKTPVKKLFGAAFGPGLTVETFTAHN